MHHHGSGIAQRSASRAWRRPHPEDFSDQPRLGRERRDRRTRGAAGSSLGCPHARGLRSVRGCSRLPPIALEEDLHRPSNPPAMCRVPGGRPRQRMPACIVLEMDDDGISPRFDQSALITIDTQIDTLDGQPLEIPGTTAALPAIATLTQSFRESGRPIIHVVRLYLADGSNAEPSRSSRVSGDTPILRPGHAGDSSPPRSSAMFQPNLMRTFFCPGASSPSDPTR